jgi:hypothetical protein
MCGLLVACCGLLQSTEHPGSQTAEVYSKALRVGCDSWMRALCLYCMVFVVEPTPAFGYPECWLVGGRGAQALIVVLKW